ncbi:MAG TPA: regulatory iron-sulfur-containing complex subunit RicT [Bacteriovoracaceae bacterium]|nr:regulatory iron-sulfur-containing complex subunit RicT [Bacteriovoracaceae bacterium]
MTTHTHVEGEESHPTDLIISEESSENAEEEQSSEEKERDSRFKEGQILRFVRVRFPGNSRSFSFLIGKRLIEYGQKVVAMSDRGMAVGYVNSFPYDVPFNKSMLPIRSISKVANEEDIISDREAYRKQKDAENICNDLIEQHKLDMHLTHVEFTSFGKKAVFYFIAPSRVDFRDLVRDLVGKLKTRIELRQISVRDRSASVGGIGPCGRELCCSSFLTKYGNVGIKMAKNQDLTLNFSKLNGVCGQLKCCLQYEDDVYREKRAKLPKENDIISTHSGEIGKVLRIHLLSEQFDILTNKGVKKRFVVEFYKDSLNREEAKFPTEFEFVTDETNKVIGMDEVAADKARAFEEQVIVDKAQSKLYADYIFEDLFGEKSLGISYPELEEPDSVKSKRVVKPEEEDEIRYTPTSEDEMPDDDDYDDEEPVRANQNQQSRPDNRGGRPQGGNQPRSNNNNNRGPRQDGPRDDRPQGQNRPPQQGQGQGPSRNNNNDRRPQQNNNRGPRPEGSRDERPRQDGPRDERPRDTRPANPNQNQNNNQNRNRPPNR